MTVAVRVRNGLTMERTKDAFDRQPDSMANKETTSFSFSSSESLRFDIQGALSGR